MEAVGKFSKAFVAFRILFHVWKLGAADTLSLAKTSSQVELDYV